VADSSSSEDSEDEKSSQTTKGSTTSTNMTITPTTTNNTTTPKATKSSPTTATTTTAPTTTAADSNLKRSGSYGRSFISKLKGSDEKKHNNEKKDKKDKKNRSRSGTNDGTTLPSLDSSSPSTERKSKGKKLFGFISKKSNKEEVSTTSSSPSTANSGGTIGKKTGKPIPAMPAESKKSAEISLPGPAERRGSITEMTAIPPLENMTARDWAAREIYTSEIQYLKNLETLVFEYLVLAKDVCTPDEIKVLFSNVAVLRNFAVKLLTEVEERIKSWGPNQLMGDIFLKFYPFFKAYNQYCNNYDAAVECYLECMKRPSFATLCAVSIILGVIM
jgi:hypothetical protein